jgi:hypothetical protein
MIYPVSFGAKLNINVPVANKARLANISQKFQEATANFPDDKLMISYCPDEAFEGYQIAHLSNIKSGSDYAAAHIIQNLNKILKNDKNDESVVKTLKNYFMSLVIDDSTHSMCKDIDERIFKLQKIKAHNQMLANLHKESGNEIYAKRYSYIAESNQGRIDSLKKEKIRRIKDFLIDNKIKYIEN